MKKLVKMKLINWHSFVNETIDIKNNVVITGENGTGKSTLLDALQYVLTAGKPKFNSAANDSGKRLIDGYIRGKLGREGKEYLREGDVVSYIVLQYYDETTKKNQLIGAILEINQSNYKKETFFHIRNQEMDDSLFFDNQHIYNRSEFKKHANKLNLMMDITDKKSSAPSLLRLALGVTSKYFDMVPKALAFKPIDQVYNFIFDFLLNEDPVKIDDLRNNVRSYRNLGNVLSEQEKRLEYLENIDQLYNEYDKKNKDLKQYEDTLNIIHAQSLQHSIKTLNKSIEKDTNQIEIDKQKVSDLEKEKENLQKDKFNTEKLLEDNEGYKLKKELENKLTIKNEQLKSIRFNYQRYVKSLNNEINVLKQLKIENDFIKHIQNNDYNSEYLNNHLFEIKDELSLKRDEYEKLRNNLNNESKIIVDEYNQFVHRYDALKNNRFYYRKEVYELIQVLKNQLNHIYGKKIEVRPLCEYLEVKDEDWRNAIEGYLNTQRFDIIIDPEYFTDAMRIYEQYKEDKGIFGVGIVNTGKLNPYSQENEGSLATLVSSENSYAKWYANMLLNRVDCVETVDDLPDHKTAITKSCMIYNHYTIRAINPAVYNKPFIGKEALNIQREFVKEKLDKLNSEIKKNQILLSEYQEKINLINNSQISYLTTSNNVIDEYNALTLSIEDLNKQIEAIQHDDSIMILIDQLEKVKKQFNNVSQEYNTKFKALNDLEHKVESNKIKVDTLEKDYKTYKDYLLMLDDQIQTIIDKYNRKYGNDYYTIENTLKEDINDLKEGMKYELNAVEKQMQAFNQEFKAGFDESIQAIETYQKIYHQLRDIEIVKRQEEVRNAKRKCEQTFQESFISRLSEKIMKAKKDIKDLNKGLSDKNFNGDSYEFEVNASKRKEYKKYYDIIVSNQQYNNDNLFVTTLSKENRAVMDELFDSIAVLGEDESSERILQHYTDYREYLDYDIKISHENGDTTKFSKVNREKSGGETQTPFYVVIASSFEQMIKNRMNEDSGCVVLFDEAFNNMDETRIKAMMNFYNELNIQIILAVPPTRASTIMPYVDTTLAIIKSQDYSYVEAIIRE